MVDSLYADQGQVDDPHLWERARDARARSRALRGATALGRGRGARPARLRGRDPRRRDRDAGAFVDGAPRLEGDVAGGLTGALAAL